jgi:SAM-dependent methyltransferase
MTTDFETSKLAVQRLVEKYKQVVASGRIKDYKEENTKKDFITPLFRALGWDTENDNSPDEVTNEDQISRGRVDYAFRLNGIPKFFLEAKALNKGLDEVKDAQQAINYAWYKGTSWAVLTDFKTLIVYNAEVKGKISDAKFIPLDCDEFVSQFQKLWWLSKTAFQEGLLDKEATSWGKKLKKVKVGEQLLSELMGYRQLLSKNIVKNNAKRNLTQSELDEAVQKIIDRLIFIRTTEDRGIEEKHLIAIAREFGDVKRGRITAKLNELYLVYDKTYNSKLFTFNPDNLEQRHLCETLEIDNEVLLKVLNGLYLSEDGLRPYDFAAIDADVLGNIYEQYLSHILSKTDKRAKVEMEEAHRHDQGIYYTPTYVVDYIVRNTLSELLKGKKAVDVEKIHVLDMACGSGSFLLKAFDVINEFYRAKDKNYAQTGLSAETDEARITRKTKILRQNIYGVDLDPKAVEIAQLNLLLKAAETKHLLPDLRNNIKCGNSLIGQRTPEDAVVSLEDESKFNWYKEFPEIVNSGGFDVIIGNPPYVRQEELAGIKKYLGATYEVYSGTADMFVYFFERELKMLKENGYFGMIVSNKWLRAGYGKNLRKFISKFWIEEFIDFGDLKVFPDATIYPCIIIIKNVSKQNPRMKVCKMETLQFGSLKEYVKTNSFTLNQAELNEKEWNIQQKEANELLNKLRFGGIPLEKYTGTRIFRGILTGLNEAFIINEETKNALVKSDPVNAEVIKPILIGAEVKRYSIASRAKYLIFIPWHFPLHKEKDITGASKVAEEAFRKQYPIIYAHLTQYKEKLENRNKDETGIRYEWYALQRCAASYYEEFEKPKIVWGNLTTRASFAFDNNKYYLNAPACILPTDSKYVLGILNSKLMSYFLRSICAERQGGFIEQKPVYVSQVPIRKPTNQQESEVTELVDNMLHLNQKLVELVGKGTDEKTRLEKDISDADAKLNQIVYRIYGITEKEKEIIERNNKTDLK